MSATKASTPSKTSLTRFGALAALLVSALCVFAAPASANAPNPTSIVVNSVKVSGTNETVTVSGTWTWDERVPTGSQKDCNDSRIGVGYSVIWGDNAANPLKVQGTNELVYVGDSSDDWVHSVTQGTQIVDGPFKKGPATLSESMLGETPEAVLNGFGPQGVSTGASTAIPTKADAEKWVSNCGPTAQSVVNGQTIGNSDPSNPEQGFPNGTWGPISHTYSTVGTHKICPVMYDPHGNEVGGNAGNENQIIAGGHNSNNDNSIESNGNKNACVVSVEPPLPAFEAKKEQEIAGSGAGFTTAKLLGKIGQTVDYKITVKDTGNTSLTLSALTDPKCDSGTISAASKSPIGPGESAFYTCDHVLTATGVYTNVGTVTGTPPGEPPITHETPPVEVEVPAAPGFEAKKEQEIAGSGAGFTTAKLLGKIGQTVDYKITVKDTGNTSLTLSALTDPKCDSGTISAASKSPIGPGESAFYTCDHVLTATGVYTNVGTVTGTPPGEPPITHETPPVEVEVPAAPGFEAKKEQEIAGSGAGFTTAKLLGKIGQTVDYKITVKDTGNTSLTLSALTDPKCDSGTISAASKSPIGPGESAFYTCDHVLTATGVYTNVGTVTGTPPGEPPITHETPPVEVEVPAAPGFEAKKEQEIAGSGAGFTTAKLLGKIGQTVDYKITVKDTGNTSLTLSALTDPKCDSGTISAASKSPIGPGESAFYTCDHVLTATGVYTNVGTVTGTPPGEPPITHETPPVEVEVPEGPNFEITKEQRFAGQSSYTTGRLVGDVGQTVDYKITVTDTGNTSLTLKALVDPKCDGGTLSGPSQSPIATGESAFFTCSHVLSTVGIYTNVATDTAESPGKEITKTSNEVEVEALAPPRPGFETKKEQRLAGEAAYTTAKLTGKLGQTVEYRIDVADTGNTTLTLGALSDPKCDPGTISAPSQSSISAGQSAFYTCRHVLTAVGSYVNVAVVTVTPPGEPPINHETPPVEVNVPPVPTQGVAPSVMAAPALKGPQGCVRGSFTASVKATDVASVTFYLDGHKLKTLTAHNAHNGLLSVTINAAKLSMGGHRVTAKITMAASAGSAKATRSITFVHCGSPVVTPHFTG